MIIVIEKVNLFTIMVIENAPANVQTVEHFIIVVEDFL